MDNRMNAKTSTRPWWKCVGAGMFFLTLASSSYGSGIITLTVSPTTLSSNSKTGTVSIYVQDTSPSDNVSNMVLNIEIANGGQYGQNPNGDAASSGNTGPLMSAVNFQPAGGVFNQIALTMNGQTLTSQTNEPVNNQTGVNSGESQLWLTSFTVSGINNKVNLPTTKTLLAVVTIDTSTNLNFPTGPWAIQFNGDQYANGKTSFGSAFQTTEAATNLSMTPEPASMALFGIMLPVLFLRRRRRLVDTIRSDFDQLSF